MCVCVFASMHAFVSACHLGDVPICCVQEYFGQPRNWVLGEMMFAEFLVSITDVPILIRNGVTYETDSFMDLQVPVKSLLLAS